MNIFPFAAIPGGLTDEPGHGQLCRPELTAAARLSPLEVPNRQSPWTEVELDDSILTLCVEFPDAKMAACSRALEHCRRSTPPGTADSLLSAMRDTLRRDADAGAVAFASAA